MAIYRLLASATGTLVKDFTVIASCLEDAIGMATDRAVHDLNCGNTEGWDMTLSFKLDEPLSLLEPKAGD